MILHKTRYDNLLTNYLLAYTSRTKWIKHILHSNFAEALSERTSEWHNRSQIAVMMLVSYNQ